jgi:uncharacterized membrane protein
MSKPLAKELEELEKAGVIGTETAEAIRAYYRDKGENSHNRLFAVFGILGAILVGLGIILIIAHNWDELSRPTKVFFSFLPLLAGQLACAFTLTRKKESLAWREGSASFLFCAVGACISLVSQVYNIHGDLATFILTWMLLCLPLVYCMNSSMVSLLYIAGITWYAVESHVYWSWREDVLSNNYNYLWLLALALPHYYFLIKRNPDSNALVFHNWILPISLSIALGTLTNAYKEIMYVGYMSLFGLFYLLGTSDFFLPMRRRTNGYLIIGTLGTMNILLMSSFNWFWTERKDSYILGSGAFNEPSLIISILVSAAALVVFIRQYKRDLLHEMQPMKVIFLLFLVLYIVGEKFPYFSLAAINVLILANGIFTIRNGARQDHLGLMNYGLLTIAALVICRFFDGHLSFILRGILFVLVGVGFFLSNYLVLKKRRLKEPEEAT